jgi:polyhydroxyalkanoate synthase
MQLIKYAPATKKAFKRPLLIIPPWINKYYILDLREKNSLINWCVSQGLTVFVIVVTGRAPRGEGFRGHMIEGPAALDAIEKAAKEINALGYCLGGTLLVSTLAYLAARKDKRVISASGLADDFSGSARDLHRRSPGFFARTQMSERGYLEGAHMANTFNAPQQRSHLVVRHHSPAGPRPVPFDLLPGTRTRRGCRRRCTAFICATCT